MGVLGMFLMICGILGVVVGLSIDTSVSSGALFGGEVTNLSLLQQQLVTIIISCFAILTGAVLVAGSVVDETLIKTAKKALRVQIGGEEAMAAIDDEERAATKRHNIIVLVVVTAMVIMFAYLVYSASN